MMTEKSIADRIIENVLSEQPDYELAGRLPLNGTMTGEELLNMKVESIPFLIKGLLPKTGVVALAGSSDAGKSSFLRQLACAIVYGEKDFLGFESNAKHHSVVYVSTEDDKHALAYLLNKQKNEDKEPADLKGLRFIFETENILAKLDRELEAQAADCVIIDTFTDIYGGDLNASNKVRSFINDFSNLSKKHNCLFIFLHHTGKRTELYPPSKDNLLGSQGFEAKMRLVIELRKDYSDPTKRHICIVKGNYLPEKDKEDSYVLLFNDNLCYTKLDERVPLHLLAKPDGKKDENAKPKGIAIQLRQEGLSVTEITEEVKSRGFKFSRSTIGGWVKDCPSGQKSLTDEDTGQIGQPCPSIQPHQGLIDDRQLAE